MRRTSLLLLTLALAGCQPAPVSAPADESVSSVAAVESAVLGEQQRAPELPVDDVWVVAEETVAAYLALTDTIGAEGGHSVEPMRALVTTDWFPREQDGFRHYQDRRIRTIGQTRFDQFAIQSARVSVSGQLEVAAFLCVDSTGVWVVDAEAPEPPEDLLQWLHDGAHQEAVTDEQLEQWQPYLDQVQPVAGKREPIVVWLVGDTVTSLRIDGTENWRGAHPCEETP